MLSDETVGNRRSLDSVWPIRELTAIKIAGMKSVLSIKDLRYWTANVQEIVMIFDFRFSILPLQNFCEISLPCVSSVIHFSAWGGSISFFRKPRAKQF